MLDPLVENWLKKFNAATHSIKTKNLHLVTRAIFPKKFSALAPTLTHSADRRQLLVLETAEKSYPSCHTRYIYHPGLQENVGAVKVRATIKRLLRPTFGNGKMLFSG